MRIRIIAVVAAIVLAAVGAVVLVVAVRGASQQAADGAKTEAVLVVTSEIPAGTSSAAIAGSAEVRRIPAAYVVAGAVASTKALLGRVASTTLEPGEQVLASRFVTPQELSASGGSAAVPKGMQEVSVAVDVARMAGGKVGVGDRVGVYVSFDGSGGQPASTGLLLDRVLVTSLASTAVQSSGTPLTGTSQKPSTSGTVLVTLAVSADDAQRLIYAAEFGKIWFSAENADSASVTSGVVTRAAIG
jgi:pilus assembly protein CpaB